MQDVMQSMSKQAQRLSEDALDKQAAAGAAWKPTAEVTKLMQIENDVRRAGTRFNAGTGPRTEPNQGQHPCCPNSFPEAGATNEKLMEPCLPTDDVIKDVRPGQAPPKWFPEHVKQAHSDRNRVASSETAHTSRVEHRLLELVEGPKHAGLGTSTVER